MNQTRKVILTVGFLASVISTMSFALLLTVPAFYDEEYVVIDTVKTTTEISRAKAENVGILATDTKLGVTKVKTNFVKAFVAGRQIEGLIIEKNQKYHAFCGNTPPPNCPQPQPNPNPNPQPGSQVEDWSYVKVEAPKAKSITRGAGVKICVLDSGASPHPDLKISKVVSFVGDDGHDAVGHSTHVQGIIAAQDNGIGIVGIAPDVTLVAMKVLNDRGSGDTNQIVQAMLSTVQERCDVVNMSLGGGGDSEAMRYAVGQVTAAGIDLFMAAGNDSGRVNVPAKYAAQFPEHAFAIAASDQNDRIAQFSSRGPEIAFGAPGVRVYSTLPVNGSQMGRNYGAADGTSMATPVAVGVCALRRAVGKACKDLVTDQGDPQLGRGRVNAFKSAS